MSYKRKFKAGNKIRTVAEYESSAQFLNYFMVHGRTTHKAWIESWQYRTLKLTIGSGALYEAIPVDADIPIREEAKNDIQV